MSDEISKSLDLAPLNTSNALVVQDEKKEYNDDVEFAREGLYDAAVKAQSAVEDMIAIAQQSQHPKAYEVLNSTIKTLADISMGIADLQLKKQRLERGNGGNNSDNNGGTVNNNLFVGSTAELQKMLEDLKGGNSDD